MKEALPQRCRKRNIPFRWHCPNCGNLVTGFQDEAGQIQATCRRCHVFMNRIVQTRRCDVIAVYAPGEYTGQSTLCADPDYNYI